MKHPCARCGKGLATLCGDCDILHSVAASSLLDDVEGALCELEQLRAENAEQAKQIERYANVLHKLNTCRGKVDDCEHWAILREFLGDHTSEFPA